MGDHFDGMNDPRLRPRMLRSITRDLLPGDDRPFPSSSELSSILSYVKTHALLTEAHSRPSDRKLIESWRSAVDDWVDRLLSLVSSNMPDKCWAGVCLLGVTCEDCSLDRFLASYTVWFQKLLSNIQPPSSTHFVKVASCASLADLFTRLSLFPNLKKDATSLAGKLIQPVLQLLSETGAEAIWEGAINLLSTLISLFPSSMLRHYDNIEAVLVKRIMSAKSTGNLSKKFANCLALLPKVRGDGDSWSLLLQKILISINVHLDDAFEGLEEGNISQNMRLLVPPGKEAPTPLGGNIVLEPSEQTIRKLHDLLVPRLSALMHSCCVMLTNPYPVQVTIPVPFLLALVGRVLQVDGSLHGSLLPFSTAMQQELLCAELPDLHTCSLDLLISIIKGVRSQLLPHAANVVRLLTDYMKKAVLPSLRVKVYSIMQILLISMGVGMALYLAQEVVNNAFVDLNDVPDINTSVTHMISSKVVKEVSLQTSRRKRKHISGSPMEKTTGNDAGVDSLNRKERSPLSVKVAALRALEALLTVGGSLRSESWRSNVDFLLINVATNATDAGWSIEGNCPISVEETPVSQVDFQHAALEALLASLLSQSHVRPPYLSQGLEIFRRGKQETGTKLATFCAHALLALEVLIHPRALPLVDDPKSSAMDEGFKHGQQNTDILSFLRDDPGLINDYEDDDEEDLEETALNGPTTYKQFENTEPLVKETAEIAARNNDAIETRQDLILNSDVEMVCAAKEESVPEKEPCSIDMTVVREKDTVVANSSDLSRDDASTDLGPAQPSSDASNVYKDTTSGFESLNKERNLVYDSDSGSLDSLPPINVDNGPDTDTDLE